VRALLDAQTPVVTLVAKAHPRHVELALRTTLAENLDMVTDTVALLVADGRRVFLDAEHFFDGYAADPDYALAVLTRAADAGAEVLALCDTNGGMLPDRVGAVVADVADRLGGARIGIHCHNDTGCAVANSLAALDAGARHVQGTLNGYGERTGNADLVTVVADLQLKRGHAVLPPERLQEATRIAHAVSEITNVVPYSRQPYVGASAFTHKAGLHASAIRVDPALYQHVDPAEVGNDMRLLVSDMAGRASVELKSRELGYDLAGDRALAGRITDEVKAREARGYTYEAADASFELLLIGELTGGPPRFFDVESWRVITESQPGGEARSEAIVHLRFGEDRVLAAGEGNGPVNALDAALRRAVGQVHPHIHDLELIDYRVRIVEPTHGTGAVTRVLVETSDGSRSWHTVGVGANVVEASWEALVEGITYGLLDTAKQRPAGVEAVSRPAVTSPR
jgi:2-isopropylmalate synthase